MCCLLVVLVKLSVLANWLARKTPLRKPNHGEGIIFRKPMPKSAHDFLGLLYYFIVFFYYICVVSIAPVWYNYFPTFMAQYSLFVLKVLLNPKQTNKQNPKARTLTVWSGTSLMHRSNFGQMPNLIDSFTRARVHWTKLLLCLNHWVTAAVFSCFFNKKPWLLMYANAVVISFFSSSVYKHKITTGIPNFGNKNMITVIVGSCEKYKIFYSLFSVASFFCIFFILIMYCCIFVLHKIYCYCCFYVLKLHLFFC